MRAVLELGVHPSRIILANPCKAVQVLLYAKKWGVQTTVFDNLDELETINRYMPEARLLLRIYANDDSALIKFGDKFGAPADMSWSLLQRAKELGLEVAGVSFHVGEYCRKRSDCLNTNVMVGTGANDAGSFRKAIKDASAVFEQAQTLGFNMRLLDIGGGFQDKNFEDIAASIREEIAQRIPTTTKIIAEPGRYYARSAYTLICRVISRRRQIIEKAKDLPDMLYQNDGLYGHFMNRLMEAENFCPILVLDGASSGKREAGPHRYTIWGPTCDGGDYIVRDTTLPCEAKVGDWLKYKNMGGKLDINCEAAFSCLMLTVSKHTLVQQRLNSTASRVIVRLYISTVTPWF
jgi:ornithine decarboxylase